MKIKRPFLLFIVVAIVSILALLWLGKKPQVTTVLNPAPTSTVSSAPSPGGAPAQKPASSIAPGAAPNAPSTSASDKSAQMREGLSLMNDVPIVFYGRLLDQFDSPVVGAQIAATVRIYSGTESTTKTLTTISDGAGMFQIDGGKGESLGIMPAKQGYVVATTDTLFKYSYMYPDHFSPDANNPTVVKMWKLQGAEPLVQISSTYKIDYTSAPLEFDLVAGKIVESGGDLLVRVNRPDGIISQQHPQNWNIDLSVINGGYIVTSTQEASITYAAPGGYYQPAGTFGNNNGPDLVDETFFTKSRNGQIYSKLHLFFEINSNPSGAMSISISGVANTNGSGNWEATAPKAP